MLWFSLMRDARSLFPTLRLDIHQLFEVSQGTIEDNCFSVDKYIRQDFNQDRDQVVPQEGLDYQQLVIVPQIRVEHDNGNLVGLIVDPAKYSLHRVPQRLCQHN